MTDLHIHALSSTPAGIRRLLHMGAGKPAKDLANLLEVRTDIVIFTGGTFLGHADPDHTEEEGDVEVSRVESDDRPLMAFARVRKTDISGHLFRNGKFDEAADIVFDWLRAIITATHRVAVYVTGYNQASYRTSDTEPKS